jgi:hypothetical protein
MNFKRDYKDWLAEKRKEWIGKKVTYRGKQYTVLDVDFNGGLLIDKPGQFTETTAVDMWMVK